MATVGRYEPDAEDKLREARALAAMAGAVNLEAVDVDSLSRTMDLCCEKIDAALEMLCVEADDDGAGGADLEIRQAALRAAGGGG